MMIDVLESRPQFQPLDGGGLLVRAPAKLNLNLLVGPRGEDGFHPLDSLVAKVTLYDRVELSPRDDRRVTLRCVGFDCGPDADNLAVRAAGLMQDAFGAGGVSIVLDKRIRPGSGLGGGSSDAAAVLAGLSHLYSLDISPSQLSAAAATLGSDVPLFLGPPTARMTGRGQHLEPQPVGDFAALLIMPDLACATPAVYAEFDRDPEPMGQQLSAAQIAVPVGDWVHLLTNQLGGAATRRYPTLGAMQADLSAAVNRGVCLSGSGSSMFVVFETAQSAIAATGHIDPTRFGRCAIVSRNSW